MQSKFEEIKERGYFYQATNEEEIKKLVDSDQPMTFYLGIDPTADSLHVGHFFALTMVRRLQKMGHHPIVLIGGATALVGDPSGKKDLRLMLTKEQVAYNQKEVTELVKKFVSVTGDNAAIIVNNADWINHENYIDFMRKVGIHFNVNKMLATDTYKNRLEQGGLTFLEMGYMLMQAYDFVHLNKEHNCILQIGGSDQWANMVAGTDLYRKMNLVDGIQGKEIYAVTCPLLVKADGEKMGKTAGGTLWVSRDRTTVYDFYQMFMNSYDEDVERLLSFFSDFTMTDIKKMCRDNIIEAKKVMAFEVTKLVHGEEEALKVKKTSAEIFSQEGTSENMPGIELSSQKFDQGIDVKDLLVEAKMVSSKSEAKRLIEQGGIKLNQVKVTDFDLIINKSLLVNNEMIIQKGKKIFIKVISK